MKRSTQKRQSGGEYAPVDGSDNIPTPFSPWFADLGQNPGVSTQMMADQAGGKKKKSPKKKSASKKKKVVKRKRSVKGGYASFSDLGLDNVANPGASAHVVDNHAGDLGANAVPNPYASRTVANHQLGGKKMKSASKKKKVVKRKRSVKGGYASLSDLGLDNVANPGASAHVVDNHAGNLGANAVPNPYASRAVVNSQFGGKKMKKSAKKSSSKKTVSKKKVVKRKRSMKGGDPLLQNLGLDDVANPVASAYVVDNHVGDLGLNAVPNPYASRAVVDYKFGGRKNSSRRYMRGGEYAPVNDPDLIPTPNSPWMLDLGENAGVSTQMMADQAGGKKMKKSASKKKVAKKSAPKKKVVKRKRSMKGGEYARVGEESMIPTPGGHWMADLGRSSGVSNQMLADQAGGKKMKKSASKKVAKKSASKKVVKKSASKKRVVKKSASKKKVMKK
jgi:hypothetical protein